MAEERLNLVSEIRSGEESLSAVCRKYGVSRPTAYKWLRRNVAGEGMDDRSRAPLRSPAKTSAAVEAVITGVREVHSFWGGRKIKAHLERKGVTGLPAPSTIMAILRRHGLISEEAALAATPYKRFEKKKPNDLWQTDFKGHFPMSDGNRCHPLTVADDMSRFNLCLSAKPHERLSGVTESFTALFREYGLPNAVLCDNGPPFGTRGMSGYSKFEVFLMDYDIRPVHGRPLHPQTQGKIERFHRTLKRELLNRISIADISHAQKEFDAFRQEYNEERPHCSLDYAVPADRYCVSERAMPVKIAAWDYPAGCLVQRVGAKGYVRLNGKLLFLSEALCGRSVAFAETQYDGVMEIMYRNFKIATIDMNDENYISRKIGRVKSDR